MKYDLTGQRFGKLVCLREVGKSERHGILWECQCDCGKITIKDSRNLLKGRTGSCGCIRNAINRERSKTHGESYSRLYCIHKGMKTRCNNPKDAHYKDYGGRGISVCDEWSEYPNFREWALNNGYDDSLTIDRIDVNGNYEPSNCRWADSKTQSNNKRTSVKYTIDGETLTSTEWAERYGISASLINTRIRKFGWDVEKAIKEPAHSIFEGYKSLKAI